jgi:putative two-component system response regulator
MEETEKTTQKANQMDIDLLAYMSHEIRTPMNAIKGFNEMILRESNEIRTIGYAMNVQAAGRMLLSIVRDILDFASLDGGTLQIEENPYETSQFILDILNYAEYTIGQNQLELRTAIDEKLPERLVGDTGRCLHIFHNIISNAMKYTKTGFVEIRMDWEPQSEEKGIIAVSITDSGIGMRDEDAGLSLPIVTRLLAMMGSSLLIKSVAGQGTVYSFRLEQKIVDSTPIGNIDAIRKSENYQNAAHENEFVAEGARILAVDDNRMNLNLFCAILKDTMITIDTAMNGQEAIQKLEQNTYHIVFMDHMMPILDGLETLKIIKERQLCQDTPVIVVTANAVEGAREKYLEIGFDDYLSKPVNNSELKKMVQHYLPDGMAVKADAKQEEEVNEPAEDDFLERLSGFLDTETALSYCCDSQEFYKEMLFTYLNNRKYADLQEFYDVGDWDNYRIQIHAVKSTSLTIGSAEISGMAKELEHAVKNEDYSFVHGHHDNFIKKYKRLLSDIESVLKGPVPQEEDVETVESQPLILIVDDSEMNLKVASKILKDSFQTECALSAAQAIAFLNRKIPDLILLDLHMPDMNGFEMMQYLQTVDAYKEIPIIFLTADEDSDAEVKGLKEGAQDFIKKPFVADIMIQRIKRVLQLNLLQKKLEQEVEKQTQEVEQKREKVERLSHQVMVTLAGTIDAKDKYTSGHSVRVAEYAKEIVRRLGRSEKEQEHIYQMGLLHDIGKIGVPDEIINKTARLTDEEYAVIREHPVIGAEILQNISEIPDIGTGARWHHERYDGSGYPDRLKGNAIPEIARIIGVADAYDAMTSNRSYRDVLPQQVVRSEIEKGKGTQFDPKFADIMLQMIDEDTEYQMRAR